MARFRTLLVDPPWEYVYWSPSGQGRRATDHYRVQATRWVERLPIEDVCERDCTLLLWATNPKLPDAFRVLEAWGFEFKSMVPWLKMTAAACPRVGLGYHARSCTEQLIIAARGSAPAPDPADRPLGVIFCPPGEHSAKPEQQYDIAEGYPGPYLELFHRPRYGALWSRLGWTFLGNEVDGQDIRDALRALAAAPQPEWEPGLVFPSPAPAPQLRLLEETTL